MIRSVSLGLIFAAAFATAASAQYSVSGPGLSIPGSGTGGSGVWQTTLPPSPGVSSLVLPANAASINEVVFTGLSHTWVGDVQIVLDDPNGGRHNLITRLGGGGPGNGSQSDFNAANLITISDAGAAFPVAPPNPVAAGVYQPHFGNWTNTGVISNDALAAIPVVPGGTYTLFAYDWVGGDTGALVGWSINGDEVPPLTVNIDIDAATGGGAGAPSPAYGGAGLAGTWNSVPAGPVAFPLVSTSGGATPLTISATAFGFAFNNALTTGDDELLLDDVADIGGTGSTVTYTINGVPTGTYEVTAYAWAPDVPTTFITGVTVADGLAGEQACGGADWSGAHVLGSTFVRDNCRVQSGSITITLRTLSGFGSFNGMQLRQIDTTGGPQNYCVSAVSVNGCTPSMAASGTPQAGGASGFTVSAINTDGGRIGGLMYGLSPSISPFGSGATLCVGAPRKRLFNRPTISSGTPGLCDGAISIDLLAFITANPLTLGAPFAAGDTVYLQGWYRDVGLGSKNIATTDGLKVTFTP